MRAATFSGQPGPLRVQDIDTPAPGPGQILVRVAACGVCTTELAHSALGFPTFKQPPVVLGHEVSGVIAEIGPGDSGLTVNDRVLLPIQFTCGTCSSCRSGRDNACLRPAVLGNHVDGGLAEYIVAPASAAIPLPVTVPLDDACIVVDAMSTPFHAVRNRARVRPGETVAVFGCGALGINVVQFAALAGAVVIAIDPQPDKLAMARQLGAQETVAGGDQAVAEVRKLLGGPADVAFAVTGLPETIQQAVGAIHPAGRACLIGVPLQPASLDAAAAVMGEVSITTALGCPSRDYERLLRLVGSGRAKVSPLVSGRYGLDDVNLAIEAVGASRGFKHIVIPQGSRPPLGVR